VEHAVFALSLEGLGSTELLYSLVIALIFFGPRKLPQLARSMGKGLAEFRKASDDFKRTWEREVALESARTEDNSLLEAEGAPVYEPAQNLETPVVETPDPELVVARETAVATNSESASETTEVSVDQPDVSAGNTQLEPQPITKQEWL
jgi:TatA/E family protein of Tat protein translocase